MSSVLIRGMASVVLALLAQACTPTVNKYLAREDAAYTLTVERTPCFGECPIYTMTLDSKEGRLHYQGERFTEPTGEVEKELPAEELDSLRLMLDAHNFTALDSAYDDEHVADLPATIITLRIAELDYRKRVRGRVDAPADFEAIEAYLERVKARHL